MRRLKPGAPLTQRERDVLGLLAQGRSTEEIAAALVIAAETVKSHVFRLGKKLGATDRVGMVLAGQRAGLLPPVVPDGCLLVPVEAWDALVAVARVSQTRPLAEVRTLGLNALRLVRNVPRRPGGAAGASGLPAAATASTGTGAPGSGLSVAPGPVAGPSRAVPLGQDATRVPIPATRASERPVVASASTGTPDASGAVSGAPRPLPGAFAAVAS